jgi:hypothetical protein
MTVLAAIFEYLSSLESVFEDLTGTHSQTFFGTWTSVEALKSDAMRISEFDLFGSCLEGTLF